MSQVILARLAKQNLSRGCLRPPQPHDPSSFLWQSCICSGQHPCCSLGSRTLSNINSVHKIRGPSQAGSPPLVTRKNSVTAWAVWFWAFLWS
uniref:Alternative protein DNAJC18 n=1 Tax=Homo sapiens TaxID=9606 RepID=L8EAR1_HUMAN|nr:alternative protein DNAJC18 [Homo sapiens]